MKVVFLQETIKYTKITFKGNYMKHFFFPISYSAFFFLSWIHFLLRLILERACVHDDGVNHFAPESSRCILSTITISFFSLYSPTLLFFVCAFIFAHLLLFKFFFFFFFLLFSFSLFCVTQPISIAIF